MYITVFLLFFKVWLFSLQENRRSEVCGYTCFSNKKRNVEVCWRRKSWKWLGNSTAQAQTYGTRNHPCLSPLQLDLGGWVLSPLSIRLLPGPWIPFDGGPHSAASHCLCAIQTDGLPPAVVCGLQSLGVPSKENNYTAHQKVWRFSSKQASTQPFESESCRKASKKWLYCCVCPLYRNWLDMTGLWLDRPASDDDMIHSWWGPVCLIVKNLLAMDPCTYLDPYVDQTRALDTEHEPLKLRYS